MSTTSEHGAIGRFFRHSAIYAVGNALNRVGAFLLLPLYTRYLAVSEYGELELYYAVAAVVSSLLSVGIAHATLRFYFEYERQDERNLVVSTNLIASFAISAVGAAAIGFLAGPVAEMVTGSRPSATGLVIVLVTLVLELSSQVCLAYLRAREKSVMFITLSLVKLVVQCIANVLLLTHFDAGIVGVLGGNLLAVALGWIVLVSYTARHCGLRVGRDKLAPVLRYSLPFLYVTVIASASSNLDRFVINRLLSMEALGVFALATKFAKLVSDLLGEPFNRAYGAFRFSIMKRDDAAAIQANILRYMAAALAIISLSLAFFTGDVLHWVATPAYAKAADLMPLLLVAASLQMLVYLFQTGIMVNKSTHQLVSITLIRSGVMAAAAYPLILALGLQGACLLALVDAVIACTLTHRASQKYFPVRYDYRRLSMLGICLCGFYLASIALPWSGWTLFGAKLLMLIGFAVLVFRSQTSASERAAVAGKLHAMRGLRLGAPAAD